MPKISVVVCTYNRSDLLNDALESLSGQTVDKYLYEIIIVDNASTDNTRKVIDAIKLKYTHYNMKYVYEPRQGLSHARNAGYAVAHGDFVAYMDDDAKADSEWLKYAVKIIDEIKPDIFGGPIYPFYLTPKPDWFKDEYEIRLVSKKSRFLNKNEFISGSNIVFRKSLLQEYGGFDSDLGMKGSELGYGEETALIIKAQASGKQIYYCSEMKVYHHVPKGKMNAIWFLVTAFESGVQWERLFHDKPRGNDRENLYSLFNKIKTVFDEMKDCIFIDDKDANNQLENRIKEKVQPQVYRLGIAYERCISIIDKYDGGEITQLIEFIREKDRLILLREKLDYKIMNSMEFRIGRVVTLPYRLAGLFSRKFRTYVRDKSNLKPSCLVWVTTGIKGSLSLLRRRTLRMDPWNRWKNHKLTHLNKKVGGYIDAIQTVNAAQARGLSVREYVEVLWDQQGCTERVIDEMKLAGCFSPCNRVCEIGPGTGRYLELVLQQVSPKQYDIYETAQDWAIWLANTYAPIVVRQPADGRTLKTTPDQSCGLVHAHGVFVYLSFLHCFEYFNEMVRVCMPNGYIVFDFYSNEHFNIDVIKRWLTSNERYPVILPRKTVLQYITERGCKLIHEFENKYGHSYSHYVILQKET